MVVKSFIRSKTVFNKKHLSFSAFFENIYSKKNEMKEQILKTEFIPGFYFFKNSKKLQFDQLDTYLDFTSIRWYKSSHEFGLEAMDPTSDSRLINLILAMPSSIFNKSATPKYLYRNMMQNNLINSVLNNRYSMRQSFDYCFRISQSQDHFKGLNFFINDNASLNKINTMLMIPELYNEIVSSSTPLFNNDTIARFLVNTSLYYWIFKNNKFNFTSIINPLYESDRQNPC